VEHGVLHPNQFGDVCQNSTDAGRFLTHIAYAGWHAKFKTSMVTFDLAQFFPSINHDVLLSILDKQGLAPEVVAFFRSYLVNQFTCYTQDNDLSLEFPSSIGVGQGSALFPILSALCLTPLLKEFECRVGVAVLISYIYDGTIIVQSDT
jgi:retron-type reverse transcriptase